MKVGSYTAAATVWGELTVLKDVFDTEGLVEDGVNGWEAQGAPLTMTCGATHVGSAVYSAAPVAFGDNGAANNRQLAQLQE
mgnify:CR=1 FL=1